MIQFDNALLHFHNMLNSCLLKIKSKNMKGNVALMGFVNAHDVTINSTLE